MTQKKILDFDKILQEAGDGSPGCKPWLTRLDKQVQEEIIAIKKRWVEGGRKPPAATLARTLIKHCAEKNIHIAKETQVSRWLRADD